VNSTQIESNLYELLDYLHEIGVADKLSSDKHNFEGFRTNESAWPYLTVCKSFSKEEVTILTGLVSNESYPSLLILGDDCLGVDEDLTEAGFRKISFWANMFLEIRQTMYVQDQDISVREVMPVEIDAWLDVVTKVLFANKTLDKNIFVSAYRNGRVRMFGAFMGTKLVGTVMLFLGTLPGLYMVAVDKEYRKRGIATMLVGHTSDFLNKEGYDMLVLHSTAEGYSFYKSMGFNDVGKMNLYYFLNKR
jgi:GNAT superfamily N-acetyltransferase